MECPYCKEEIKEGAKKCKVCKEVLDHTRSFKNFMSVMSGLLPVFVSLGSLSIAYLEYQGRVRAVDEKEIVERNKEAAEDILRRIPIESISDAARDELRPKERPEFKTILPDKESQRRQKQIEELVSQGNRALESGEDDRANEIFQEAARLERTSPQIRQTSEPLVPKSLGYLYLRRGEPERAMQEFEKALERAPDDLEARKGLIYSETLIKSQRR